MKIKYNQLAGFLNQNVPIMYVLSGQDHYLSTDAMRQIKQAWQSKHPDSETKTLHMIKPEDWQALVHEANAYDLFNEFSLIDVYFEKKTMDATGKNQLQAYLDHPNPNTAIVLRFSEPSASSVTWLANHPKVLLLQLTSLTPAELARWIQTALHQHQIKYEADVPHLIQLYTQGNQWATAQIIEKITLFLNPDETLTTKILKEHLVDQSIHQRYDLSDACLRGDFTNAIRLLLAQNYQTEASLILWLLTQDLRQLIELKHLIQNMSLSNAFKERNIWSQKTPLFEAAMKRLDHKKLHELLLESQRIDTLIKNNQTVLIQQSFERWILSFCQPEWHITGVL